MRTSPSRAVLATVLAVLGVLAAPSLAAAAITARGSVEQAYVLGARPGERLALLDARGRTVARGKADRLGSRIFRDLAPRAGYRVRGRGGRRTRAFAVLRGRDAPRAAFYRGRRLRAGLNYVRMRDGVELAMTVRLPAGKTLAEGPFPTVIEHSGYQTAAPHDLLTS